MAASAEMGEVEDVVHNNKDENITDDIVVVNGTKDHDENDEDNNDHDEELSTTKSDDEDDEAPESMEVDESVASQEDHATVNSDTDSDSDSKDTQESITTTTTAAAAVAVGKKDNSDNNSVSEVLDSSVDSVVTAESVTADSVTTTADVIHDVDDNSDDEDDEEEPEEVEDEEEEDEDDVEMTVVVAADEDDSSKAVVNGDSVEDDDEVTISGECERTPPPLPKENGRSHSSPVKGKDKDGGDGDGGVEEIIDLDTPVKGGDGKLTADELTPRRSGRNLTRNRDSIIEDSPSDTSADTEESDIEEILPEDPLAGPDQSTTGKSHRKPQSSIIRHPASSSSLSITKTTINPSQLSQSQQSSQQSLLHHSTSATIVVKDTKRLVEIASKNNPASNNPGKKEPTLVIIDTNSILSGRGGIPLAHKTSGGTATINSAQFNSQQQQLGGYSGNMRATITPIPQSKTAQQQHMQSQQQQQQLQQQQLQQQQQQQPILPSLTDDMFVVEAPSFIVPYVYEKPPKNELKKTLVEMMAEIKKAIELEEEEKRKKDKEDGKKTGDSEDEDEQPPVKSSPDKDSKDKDDVILVKETRKTHLFFDSPIGKFFTDIGVSLVQEYVQTDLLKQQKRKRDREGGQNTQTNRTIQSLIKNLEFTRGNNEQFRMSMKKCEFCSYRTESALTMALHLETPHMKNYVYKCNYCPYEVRSPHDILFHTEAEHCMRGRLERASAFHQCPNCPFEDNQKGKLSRHLVACARKFKPERNLEPPLDWEPPAKIPRIPRMKQHHHHHTPSNGNSAASVAAAAAAAAALATAGSGVGGAGSLSNTAAMYQAMAMKSGQYQLLSKMQQVAAAVAQHQQGGGGVNRGRGRPSMGIGGSPKTAAQVQAQVAAQMVRTPQGMVFKQAMSGGSVLVPSGYQLSGNQLYQVIGQDMGGRIGGPMTTLIPNISSATTINMQSSPTAKKSNHQPSISITPLPRGGGGNSNTTSGGGSSNVAGGLKPGDASATTGDGKSSFVICEICDGYIKDLEQLRNHMQWIHKVKIHPKMIYNRPPLNCQKCQFRFFTDQGLERHLLGSHGLVTSSMQEAANKSKDSGRCPVCGRVYQWKLLNHVARDHNMTLKPAHLSYKCTVCTATFGMYKQFENHVYSAHSVVAKRVMDKKQQAAAAAAAATKSPMAAGESLLKPLKINDEITIIPQMPKASTGGGNSSNGSIGGSKPRSSGGGGGGGATAAAVGAAMAKLSQVTVSAAQPLGGGATTLTAASPSTSKNSETTSLSRAERLARRKTSVGVDN